MDRRNDSRGSAAVTVPEGTYAELVRSLFGALGPALIMAVCFVVVGNLIGWQANDPILLLLTGTGAIVAGGRMTIALLARPIVADEQLAIGTIRTLERAFAAAYLCFAAILGLMAARALAVGAPNTHILIAALLFGYGAGVSAAISLRPWISISAVSLAMIPTIVLAAFTPDMMLRAFALLMLAYAGGGIHSMLTRCRTEAGQITMRQLFSTLARRDDLTGLPNRLSLRERFVAATGASKAGVAIHCLDLDRFKPVNDDHGHPVGDALLKAVAERLTGLLRHSDFAARVGGDEFVVVQTAIGHVGEAELLARRILRAVAQPYDIDGRRIEIGTSVGYALSVDCGHELDRLMHCADQALYEAKRSGGVAAHRETPADPLPKAV